MEGKPKAEGGTGKGKRVQRVWYGVTGLVLLGAIGTLPTLARWQRRGEQQALSLSNLRRITLGLQLYAQDYDSGLMPPTQRLPSGAWRTWPQNVRPYAGPQEIFSSPTNPVPFQNSGLQDPRTGCPTNASYALNRRVYGVFHAGPFPLDNLELPANTILLVEAGRMSRQTRRVSGSPSFARLDYGDMTDRANGLVCYPSTHNGLMALAAADGHAILLFVEHYSQSDGPHNTLYGRIGGDLYNWNGGHENGALDRPVRE